jgi:hypothetical protein
MDTPETLQDVTCCSVQPMGKDTVLVDLQTRTMKPVAFGESMGSN